jgi:hypothetical protein
MSNAPDPREKLRQRIREKKRQIEAFLARTEHRSNRLTIVGIVCAGLAGLITAGPAAGGPPLTQALTEVLGTTTPSWRLLCAAATVLSFLATTALAIHKIQDLPNRVAKAQAAYSRLEGLETLLDTTEIGTAKAAEQYTQVVHDLSFVPPPGSLFAHTSTGQSSNWN